MLKRILVAGVAFAALLSICQSSQAQVEFDAQWLIFNRDNDANGNIVNGPTSVGLGQGDYGTTSGYRLSLGGSLPYFDVDATFSQLDTWEDRTSGTFSEIIVLDTGIDGEDLSSVNRLAAFTALGQAARFADLVAGDDETTESERIIRPTDLPSVYDTVFGFDSFDEPSYATFQESNFREFEVNIGTPRECRRWQFAIGYRHIKVDERSGVAISGLFDALDTDDGNRFDGSMADDPNNGLGNEAIIGVGMSSFDGAADGFDAVFDTTDPAMVIAPDVVTYAINGNADNELNGAQAVFIGRLFDGDWVTVEGIGKAGIYSNNVRASVSEFLIGSGNDDSVYNRAFSSDDTTAAFAGNIGVRGTVSLTDYINIIAGYEVIFLSGVALGPDQIHGLSEDLLGNTRYDVQHDGTIVLYGGNLGLELLW